MISVISPDEPEPAGETQIPVIIADYLNDDSNGFEPFAALTPGVKENGTDVPFDEFEETLVNAHLNGGNVPTYVTLVTPGQSAFTLSGGGARAQDGWAYWFVKDDGTVTLETLVHAAGDILIPEDAALAFMNISPV